MAVSLAATKVALRLPSDLTDEDSYLTTLIKSAEEYIERLSGVVIQPRTYRLSFSYFCGPQVPITLFPFNSFTSLTLDGTTTNSYYIEPSTNGTSYIIYPDWQDFNNTLSPEKYLKPNNVVAEFVLGYSSIPNNIIAAILNLVGFMYQNREMFPKANIDMSRFAMHPLLAVSGTNIYG